jgi:broad specificity phosphatase PhoE
MARQSGCTVILVRHGETAANRLRCFADSADLPLTEVGREQAHNAARRLSERFRPARVFSSEFLRARQTAAIIASFPKVGVEIMAGIHDRDFGCLRGQPYERLGELMSNDPGCAAARSWLWSPPGGESLEDVRLRVMKALGTLLLRSPEQDVVVVCHGAVIQAICAHISGDWSEAFVPPNCGIVSLRSKGQEWELATENESNFFCARPQ